MVFETWNKDYVEVEAFVEGENLSAKEKKEIFDSWKLDVLGNSKKVLITSKSNSFWYDIDNKHDMHNMESLKRLEALKEMPILDELQHFDWNVVVPDVPRLEKVPVWPFDGNRPNIKSGNEYRHFYVENKKEATFDIGKYEQDKQGYVDKLNKAYKTKVTVKQVDKWLVEVEDWSANIEDVMEDWGEKFGREFELKFGPEFEKKMEAWGESFGKSMEVWGENFGKEMEKWGEQFGRDVEKWAEQFDENDSYSKQEITDEHGNKSIIVQGSKSNKGKSVNTKAKKKIIIRMPKGTKTDINVRYGEVKMADVHNINATLNYTSFIANSIDGGKSLINASYAPVSVNNWNDGVLKVNYVEDCKLNTVKEINLQANSSDVSINRITGNANLSGSFGNLYIYNVSNNFGTIDIDLDNTDATMKIPDTAFSFYFNGKKSTLKYPKSVQLDLTKKDGL